MDAKVWMWSLHEEDEHSADMKVHLPYTYTFTMRGNSAQSPLMSVHDDQAKITKSNDTATFLIFFDRSISVNIIILYSKKVQSVCPISFLLILLLLIPNAIYNLHHAAVAVHGSWLTE